MAYRDALRYVESLGMSVSSDGVAFCWPLGSLLNMQGIECEYVETDLGEMNHIWLRLADGRVLDPTIDQFNYLFNESWPPVYLGPPTKVSRARFA